jgi:hypothetical protein
VLKALLGTQMKTNLKLPERLPMKKFMIRQGISHKKEGFTLDQVVLNSNLKLDLGLLERILSL